MIRNRTVLAALLLSLALPAQGAVDAAAKKHYDTLVAEWTAANDAYRAAMKELQASDAYKAAREAKDTAKLRELGATVARPDAKAFGTRVLELADAAGKDGAMAYYVFATSNLPDKDTVVAIVERVRKDYIDSAAIVPLLENAMTLSRFLGPEEGKKFLDEVIAKNQNALARGWAMYWQATTLQRNRNASDEDKAAAEKLLADAEALAQGTDLADRIAAPRFEKERLQQGMEAPEITGEDLEGVAFKLSDYRGKVVLLDFWGFW